MQALTLGRRSRRCRTYREGDQRNYRHNEKLETGTHGSLLWGLDGPMDAAAMLVPFQRVRQLLPSATKRSRIWIDLPVRWPVATCSRVHFCAYGNGLCGDLGVGIFQLEARLLSSEAECRQVLELLCKPTQLSGGELHISSLPHGEAAKRLDWGNASRVQVRGKSPSKHHAYQASPRRGWAIVGVHRYPAAIAAFAEVGAGAVSTAAVSEMRLNPSQGVFEGTSRPFPRRV